MTTEWSVEYAPTGRAKCKKSKEPIAKGEIRFGKTTQMPEDPEKTMTSYFKSLPFFQMLAAMRKTTVKPTVADLAGFDSLSDADQAQVTTWFSDFEDEGVDWPPKPEKKRKVEAEDADAGGGAAAAADAGASPKKAKKAAAAADAPVDEGYGVREGAWENKELRRALYEELLEAARAKGIKIPSTMDAVTLKENVGAIMMANRAGDGQADVDAGAVLRALDERWGREKPLIECACAANAPMLTLFDELANFELKAKSQGGLAYKKAVKVLRALEAPIASGKEAMKLDGIGKSIGGKIDEFLASGTIAKLEEHRANS